MTLRILATIGAAILIAAPLSIGAFQVGIRMGELEASCGLPQLLPTRSVPILPAIIEAR